MADITAKEWLEKANDLLERSPGVLIFAKWTCPGCGERALADEANILHTEGYLHTDCGTMYRGNLFGMAVILPVS